MPKHLGRGRPKSSPQQLGTIAPSTGAHVPLIELQQVLGSLATRLTSHLGEYLNESCEIRRQLPEEAGKAFARTRTEIRRKMSVRRATDFTVVIEAHRTALEALPEKPGYKKCVVTHVSQASRLQRPDLIASRQEGLRQGPGTIDIRSGRRAPSQAALQEIDEIGDCEGTGVRIERDESARDELCEELSRS